MGLATLIYQLLKLHLRHGNLPVVTMPNWYEVVTDAEVQNVILDPEDHSDTVKAVVIKTDIDLTLK